MIKAAVDLEVYKMAYGLAMDVFQLTRLFTKEEKYSLVDQMVRSSRSIAANISEGWGRRVYENEFKKHLIYALGSLEETKTWLTFSKDCTYLSINQFSAIIEKCNHLGAKIFKLYENWKTL